ncbi:MAG: SDR family NAD(P)-dependent oxidoreductase [Luteolibacter sp.]
MEGDSGKRIVVTGASSGIGREIAVQLAAPGNEIWLIGRDRQRLGEVAAEVESRGGVAKVAVLDLSDLDAVDVFLEGFPAEFQVDEVYLAAAITAFGEFQHMRHEDWNLIYRTNLLSAVQLTQHFYCGMVERGGGKIILVSSLASYAGYPTATAYATMKAGLLGMFRSLQYEGEAHGVSIHHASPGYVGTGIYKAAIYRNTTYEATMDSIKKLGFSLLSAEKAAKTIIRGVARGRRDFAFPYYASAMKWIAPRFPCVITLVHARMMGIFRITS